MKVLQVTNNLGITFNVRLVEEKGKKVVEFYDATNVKENEYGKLVTKYYYDTLFEDEPSVGLILVAGVKNWVVTRDNMMEIYKCFQ